MSSTETETDGKGLSLVDLTDAQDDADDDGTPQLVLPGTGSPLTTTAGGRKPTESYFKMSAVALPIGGNLQMAKDEELWIAVPVAIDKIEHVNRRKNGEIVSVKRVHVASAIGQPIILDGPPGGVE